MMPENPNVLSSDKPLTDPKDDRLGYATFARHLAESICKMTPPEGLVIAIYGPWGAGKTTLLNFVVHYLQQKPKDEQPVIVHFNPWWFSGHEDLTRRFFDQLQAVLSQWGIIGKQLKKRMADFAEIVSETPLPHASIGKVAAKLFGAKQKDVAELKDSIVNTLKKQKRRILVIIDDIDRLTAEEIRQLFRVIKAVADFPNVIYLLALDKEVAIKAVEQMQDLPGEAYLEKVVQVPFELPLPDKTSLRRLLFEKLDVILVDTPNELFDQIYWGNVYWDGIDHFITTPRDIVRLVNTMSVTYPAVKGEVNPVDFIAIETLRVFCPMVYDIIRKNPEAFTGSTNITGLDRHKVENLKSFHNSWLDQVQKEDRESVKGILMRIFPKLEAVWGNTYYGADWESKWRKQLRACSLDIFPTYFRLAIPEGGISNAEMKVLLALTYNAEVFGAILVELAGQKHPDGTTRVRAFLERFQDYTGKEIPLEHIPSVLQALFDVGDQLLRPEDEPRGIFGFGNAVRIERIIRRLLLRLDEPSRFEVLRRAISNGKAIAIIVREVVTLGQQHGKYGSEQPRPEEEKLITVEHLDELEKIALEKVRDAAQQGVLLQAPDLRYILYAWRNWAGEAEVRQWVQKVISDDIGLVNLLEKFLGKDFILGMSFFSRSLSDRVERIRYRLDPQWLEPFLEASHQIIDRVRNLAEDSRLTENQRTAMRVFIREYELRQQGKDPNSPSAWEVEYVPSR